jgi:radical SAM protein with 4Fe4S-binding SPASM domain
MIKFSEIGKVDRIKLTDVIPLSFPLTIYLEPTNICNYKCQYCPVSLSEYRPPIATMTLDQFNKIAQQIYEGGHLRSLRFWNFGEPLLNHNLPEMLRIAKYMNLADRMDLTSNGVYLSDQNMRGMIAAELDQFRISISSVNQTKNESITQSKIKVDMLRKNMQLFKELRGDKTKPFFCIKKIDLGDLEDNQLFLDYYSAFADLHDCEVVLEGVHTEDGSMIQNGWRQARNEKLICPHPFYTLVICSNGDVVACCEDWRRATKFGNCFETSLKQIWNSAVHKRFLAMHCHGKQKNNLACENCDYKEITTDNIDTIDRRLFD